MGEATEKALSPQVRCLALCGGARRVCIGGVEATGWGVVVEQVGDVGGGPGCGGGF